MRSVHAVVEFQVTGYVHIAGCLPLEQREETFYSAYNPPIRYLSSEAEAGVAPLSPFNARLVSFTPLLPSDLLAVFRFKTDQPINYEPGQHVILDMSALLPAHATAYKHMANYRGGEKELNDDGVRTWTISSAQPSPSSDSFQVTMRLFHDGSITPMLFAFGQAVLERNDGKFEGGAEFSVPLIGIGGDFTLAAARERASLLTFIAGGIGITPFLPMLKALSDRGTKVDVDMVVAVKQGELDVVQRLIEDAVDRDGAGPPESLSVVVHLLSSRPPSSQPRPCAFVRHHTVRLSDHTLRDFKLRHAVDGAVYVCGSPSFEQAARRALAEIGVDGKEIKTESFNY
jgi:ferredoxin-NADP reductase